jgi:uncharacterized protein
MTQNGTSFERRSDVTPETPTLIEGLPGLGMVASIATDRITEQLGLDEYGVIRSDELPPVTTFENGRVHDLVRVSAGVDPSVMTLQSDLPIPPNAFGSLARCVLDDLTEVFDRAVFLAGVPAEDEEQRGDIFGVATTDSVESQLEEAGIELAEGPGLLGGATGALVSECYHADVPAAVLVVRATPYLPDPGAARTLIEEALEPLVHFDIDTSELVEQADRIRKQKQQIAQQLKQQQATQGQGTRSPSMYQ